MIHWIETLFEFTPVETALTETTVLLAPGGSLSPEWLIAAYKRGIFPWFSPGDPILWWSPDPRMIAIPGQQSFSRSLRKTLRANRFEVRCDTAFAEVIRACAAPRSYANGTWIVPAMQEAYLRLHELGWAHSVESWHDGELVGGLYGVAIGGAFLGVSMFHRATDASKVAFAHLIHVLEQENYGILDCQMHTPHLASLGAREISRTEYSSRLADLVHETRPTRRWPENFANRDWNTGCHS